MKDVVFKSIVFVENGNLAKGYFFYNAPHDSDYGNILGLNGLTLPKALAKMKEKGIDAVKNVKMNIISFYY